MTENDSPIVIEGTVKTPFDGDREGYIIELGGDVFDPIKYFIGGDRVRLVITRLP